MFRFLKLIPMIVLASQLGACAVISAATQPGEKDLGLLKDGTKRSDLIAEFGVPMPFEAASDGSRQEVFEIVQGYSDENRVGRVVAHGLLDIGTLFFWEAIGTPLEQHFNGTTMLVKVSYNDQNEVKTIYRLTPQ